MGDVARQIQRLSLTHAHTCTHVHTHAHIGDSQHSVAITGHSGGHHTVLQPGVCGGDGRGVWSSSGMISFGSSRLPTDRKGMRKLYTPTQPLEGEWCKRRFS